MARDTKKQTKRYSPLDFIWLVLTPVTASIVTLLLPVNLLVATVLLFGPPAVYISLRRKDVVLRSLVYSLTIATISILTDYLAERDQSWVSTTMFSFKLLGWVPVEAFVWTCMFTYLIVAYYLYFFDNARHAVVGRRMKPVFFAALAVVAWLCVAAVVGAQFTISYYYIKCGLLFIFLPLLAFVICFPQYLRAFLKMTPYFMVLGLVNILVGLQMGHWTYPGEHFVGWVYVGSLRFPVEELVFWIILYAPFLISQFELFNNDRLDVRSSWIVRHTKKHSSRKL